jgi:hypothetical protein
MGKLAPCSKKSNAKSDVPKTRHPHESKGSELFDFAPPLPDVARPIATEDDHPRPRPNFGILRIGSRAIPTLKGKLFKPASLVIPHFSRVRHHTTGRRFIVLLLFTRANRALRFWRTCRKTVVELGNGLHVQKVPVFALLG